MRTISQAVEEIIQRSPFLAETIAEGIANNAQVARRIKPDVEKRLLEKVSESAIAMALHRMSKQLRKQNFGEKMLKHIHDITVRSNLVELVFSNSAAPELLDELLVGAKKRRNAFVNLSRGLHESLLVINKEFEKEIEEVLRKQKNLRRKGSLSAITMRLPETTLDLPGVYYPILKAIAFEGISFVEIMSVDTEFSILFEDKDVDRAFSVLKRITS
jgi:hypothetical protein